MTAFPWPVVPVAEVCSSIVDCVNKTAPTVPGPTPYRMIRTTNVRDGFVDLSEVRYVEEAVYKTWTRRQVPRPGDVILTREAPLGEVGILRDAEGIFLGQRLMSYRVDPRRYDARFLLYVLLGPGLQAQIRALGSGSTVEHMRVPDAERLLVPLPPLDTQRRIAGILSAYDDLIENNERRIAILEDMARRVFREWFVDFRFPGHEAVRMVDTEAGRIPEGWSWCALGKVLTIIRGRSYRSAELVETGGSPFVNLKCIDRGGGFRQSGLKRFSGPHKAEQTVAAGDIVVAVTDMTQERRIVAQAARVPTLEDGPGVISMDLVKIEPMSGVDKDFLYAMLRFSSFSETVRQHANGANVLHLSPTSIAAYETSWPPPHLQAAYARLAAGLLNLSDRLSAGSEALRRSRDLLLPRLISGELPVSAAEPLVEAAE